jgi:hypothetical protein
MVDDLISAADLAELHDLHTSALTDTCTITNPVAPGVTPVTQTTIRCAMIRTTNASMDGAGYAPIAKAVEYTIVLPLNTDVRTGAVIVLASGGTWKAGEIVRPASFSHCIYAQVTEVPA